MKSEWTLTFGTLVRNKENQKLIQVCMRRWQARNEYGRSVGRGLSHAELIDRVVDETGASRTLVLDSLALKD